MKQNNSKYPTSAKVNESCSIHHIGSIIRKKDKAALTCVIAVNFA